MPSRTCFALALFLGASLAANTRAAVVTSLPPEGRPIALTFDACETRTPSYLDQGIVGFLEARHLPATFFVSGKFAKRNRKEVAKLAQNPLFEVENHSLNHPMHMERLAPEAQQREVEENSRLLKEITGRTPHFFRFPAGNYDAATLARVEALNYQVVHWSFASGDPDPNISSTKLIRGVLSQAKAGSILIFHANGRGYHTAEALPAIVDQLLARGYHFVRLDEALR